MIESLDTSDLDAIEDLIRSEGYEHLKAKIAAELKREADRLEGNLDPLLTAECRGRIKMLRLVLEMPNILRAEIAAELKEGN